ncbi:hypothetical protein E2C01_015805 [Portunus trituberculatus]|uniref:Uncharacterized protein n=1 Tax=Portunus trituberculatus TaxID=210409 RepID=A0A5B7DNX6_PORTR|nr:hypothetical protein [Portunus trituberculatus]
MVTLRVYPLLALLVLLCANRVRALAFRSTRGQLEAAAQVTAVPLDGLDRELNAQVTCLSVLVVESEGSE